MAKRFYLSDIRGISVFMVSAFELATGVCGLKTDSKVDAGTYNAISEISYWWHKPENSNRSVTIGEAATWYAGRMYERCLNRNAKSLEVTSDKSV